MKQEIKDLTTSDLRKMPTTKAMLINYISCMYEADAVITDDYLVMEYNMLKKENRLHELFDQELLDNMWVGIEESKCG